MNTHLAPVRGVALLRLGTLAASGDEHGQIVLWNLESASVETAVTDAHAGAIVGLAELPDGDRFASVGVDGFLCIWDRRGSRVARHRVPGDGVTVVASASGTTLLFVGGSSGVDILDAGSGEWVAHSTSPPVTALAIAHQRVAVFASGCELFTWDSRSSDGCVRSATLAAPVLALAIFEDGAGVLCGPKHTTKVFAFETGRDETRDIVGIRLSDGTERLRLSGHGRLVSQAYFFSTTNWYTGASVGALAVAGDDEVAVSGGVDGTVCVWSVAGQQSTTLSNPRDPLATLQAHSAPVTALALDRERRCMISASEDGVVRIWRFDVADPAALGRTSEVDHLGPVTAVAFEAGGRLAVSAGKDAKLRVRDRATLQVAGSLDAGSADVPMTIEALASAGNAAEVRALGRIPIGLRYRARFSLEPLRLLEESLVPEGRISNDGYRSQGEEYQLGPSIGEVAVASVDLDARRAATADPAGAAVGIWNLSPYRGVLVEPEGVGVLARWLLERVAPRHSFFAYRNLPSCSLFILDGGSRLLVVVPGVGVRESYEVLEGALHRNFDLGSRAIEDLAIAARGDRLVVILGGRLVVWRLEDEAAPMELGRARPPVATSDDGRVALTCDAWGGARLWSVDDGLELASFTGDGRATSLALDGRGQDLLVGEDDGRVHLLTLEGSRGREQ